MIPPILFYIVTILIRVRLLNPAIVRFTNRVLVALGGLDMRQSNFSGIRIARGTLFLTAISVLSLHAVAQSGDAQTPLPNPVFSAAPGLAPTTVIPQATATDVKLADDATAPAAAAAAMPTVPAGNRVSGFAVPIEPAAPAAKAPTPATAKQAAVAQSAAMAGASSRAGIRRLNQTVAPIKAGLHPVAEAYPGFEVIVCVAGCGPEPKAVSVYKPKLNSFVDADMSGGMPSGFIRASMTTSTNAPTECLAGCYDNTPTRTHTPTPKNAPAAVPSAGSPVGATDRSVMVQTSGEALPGVVPVKAKTKSAKKPGSEWFTRRFERKPVPAY
jgi:hypothetical protein